VSYRVGMLVSAYGRSVFHQVLVKALNDAGSQCFSADWMPHAPWFLRDASVGSMNSRYSYQSRYEHMPYMCRTSGMFSHDEEPYVSYERTGCLSLDVEEQFWAYISNSMDSSRWFSTCRRQRIGFSPKNV
jgi:hypothetical protein